MSGAQAPAPTPPGGGMMMMLLFMVLMTFMLMSGDIRGTLGEYADPILSPWLPEDTSFILTVWVLGSISMFVNTALRNVFMDPVSQAHIGHRQSQVRKMMNEARVGRDPILMEKAQTLQQHMMPEQMKIQMGAMKPMMFTMFFIIAIFAWIGTMVADFRVDYVSLPWVPEWNLLHDTFIFFPAWIAAYICMSAPLGRVVDRHIKLFRYKSHPLVESGEHIKEPLIHLVASNKSTTSREASSRQRKSRSRRNTPRKSASKDQEVKKAKTKSTGDCPECGSDMVERDGPNQMICQICRHEWR